MRDVGREVLNLSLRYVNLINELRHTRPVLRLCPEIYLPLQVFVDRVKRLEVDLIRAPSVTIERKTLPRPEKNSMRQKLVDHCTCKFIKNQLNVFIEKIVHFSDDFLSEKKPLI